MEFFNKVGKMAIGSRLRMLTEAISEDAARIYKLYDIDFQPKWFPVFYVLQNSGEFTITAIAREIGHSHPSVSKIIAEMVKNGFVIEKKDKADGRRNMVSLSAKGIEVGKKIQDQYADVTNAVEELLAQANHDLWKAIEEWEYLLEQKSLLRRVQAHQKIRESNKVQIVPYEPRYAQAFKALNEEWISKYFVMEEADYKALDNADGYIINNGGHILIALYNDEPVGVCALLKMDDPDYDYELAKMAVSPKAQGKNIGFLLGQAIIEKAKALGSHKLYLESNTILKPAISLYHKLGFVKVAGRPSPYERANIQMELELK
ncbi:bifunctional helix-turn-helix transcriptional regulator/GNAT family N-acetyltransferase [Mucilaginibacter gossypii]|uniref:bifunctional helix-turn-helix transcriptional regulator/GNAT family N-acetyltransferase n=1 Tax=Mucilaginibacter gossypii TaxID=551996 RepID=UPI000DCBDDEE|nr:MULTISPECIES: bifunctional helix-turn-helix transcriptional regulator/GNAT family N-acetyltransferase [Mucilaginibacter]QTE34693.1 bifunctional helix-turn-helix transcriptional regulator/GNAT family N-acetyltransferase [Mucilaginibacter gossypii]RAV57789.1 MarR family transcriptional regulator [Mucilaginibacter rubeus]